MKKKKDLEMRFLKAELFSLFFFLPERYVMPEMLQKTRTQRRTSTRVYTEEQWKSSSGEWKNAFCVNAPLSGALLF